MRPSLEWFRGMSSEKKASFEQSLRNNTHILDRLNEIVDEWEKEITKQEISDEFPPAWALKQAFLQGDRRRLQRMRDLLSFTKEP